MALAIIPPSLLGVESFRASIRQLLGLTAEQLGQVRDAVEAEKTISVTDSLIVRVGQAWELSEIEAMKTLSISSFLYEHVATEEDTEALVSDLREVATGLDIGDFPSKEEALKRLFSPIPAYDRQVVRSRTIESPMPVLDSWSLYCDLRVVPKEGGTELMGYVPVIVARLRFDEPIAGQDGMFFQITEETLKRFLADVERIGGILEQVKLDEKEKLY